MNYPPLEVPSDTIPVDFFGNWTPAHQQAAGHKAAHFVEVSKTQFYDAIGPCDIVSTAEVTAAARYSRFSTRADVTVGRVYADGRGFSPSRYLLSVGFAKRRNDALLRTSTHRLTKETP